MGSAAPVMAPAKGKAVSVMGGGVEEGGNNKGKGGDGKQVTGKAETAKSTMVGTGCFDDWCRGGGCFGD